MIELSAAAIAWLSIGAVSALGVLIYPINLMIQNRERAAQRKFIAKMAQEKIDALKTAITMGYSDQAVAHLDSMLEKIIGEETLIRVLNAAQPEALNQTKDEDAQADDPGEFDETDDKPAKRKKQKQG
jgi:hypothetical protein